MPFVKGDERINRVGRPVGSKNKATLYKERILEILRQRDGEVFSMDIKDLAYIGSKFVPKEIKQQGDTDKTIIVNFGSKKETDGSNSRFRITR